VDRLGTCPWLRTCDVLSRLSGIEPLHGWRYDVTTGYTMHDPEERVTCYPVQVVDGTIGVDVT
jgi:nitrite reductase/ring-hydroxylating ferredoxin subunit